MTTKEALKKAIDKLSDQEAEQLYQYLAEKEEEKTPKKEGGNIPSFKLKGVLDDQNIRELANE